jgi:hypothetical protein
MALNQDKKDKIRENMDYQRNGRLTAVANKAASLNAPILIIGLGGTGVDSVIKVKKMIYDRLQCEMKSGEIMDKPANIEYLVMDTDRDNENKSAGGVRFNEALKECFIFTSSNIQRKLESNSLPNYIESWIDKGIDVSEVINGAGAIRQVGRFMLFDNLKDIEDAIESKIRRVTAPFDNQVPLYVFILAGISGGTGSGSFVDIPYIVKGITRKIDDNRVVNRIGLLFLPDVSLSQPGLATTKKENIKKNGFAALKELDYLMNVSATGDCYEQDYGAFKIGKNADGDIPPFETCILMSSKDQNGITMLNPYEYILNVASETIVNFIASEPNVDVGHFSINSFLSNDKSDTATFSTLLGDNRRPVNYKYAVAGASSAKLPLDDIMSYMTYLAFKEVDGLWNRNPSDSEVIEALNSFGVEQKNMEMNLCMGAPVIQNLARHTYDLIKQAPQMVIGEFDAIYEQRKKYIDSKMAEMIQDLKSQIASDSNVIIEMFKDLNRGPVYSQRLIFTTSDNLCITKVLKEMNRYFNTNGPTANQIDGLKKISEGKLNELLASKPLLAGSKAKLRDEFIKASSNYYDALFKFYYYDTLAEMCVQYHNMFLDKNNEVYDCIADMLATLIELFNKFADIRTEKTEVEEGNNKTMSWSIISTPDFIRELEKRMGKNDDLYVNLHAFVTEFYTYLFENSDIWNGKEKADIIENLNYFISKSFDNVLNKSMDYYIDFIAKSYGQTAKDFSQDIFSKLLSRSNIKFPMRATYNTTIDNPGYSYVSVPINATEIKKVIKGGVNEKSIVKESGILDGLFMMNFKSAMPLSAYADLAECHKTYSLLAGSNHGLHLFEGKRANWRSLPSPYPQSEWETGHFIQHEAEENKKYYEVFNKAKELGYIKLEKNVDGTPCYICYWGEPIDVDGILKANAVDPDNKTNNPASAIACIDEMNEKLNQENRLANSRHIYSGRNVILEDNSKIVDDDYARNIFIKMVSARTAVTNMVVNHEKCVETLSKLEPYIMRKKLYIKYVKLVYTATISKKRGEYVFLDKADAIQSFCRLEGTQNDYPEYYLFNHFFKKQLDNDKVYTEDLMKVCDKIYAQNQKDDEAYDSMKNRLSEYVSQLKDVINTLNSDWREVDNGADIISLYKDLQKTAESELKGM